MKTETVIRYILVILCAVALTACSGGGSGPAGGVQGDGAIGIAITSPTTGVEMETPDENVVLQGTATSNYTIVSVSWVNDRGSEGEASGSTSWTTGGIPLGFGDNTITITAEDSSGATASRTVLIKRESGGTGSVTLSWTAPTTREDGTSLTNLAGYYIRYGRMSGVYDYEIKVDNPGVTTYLVEGLQSGTWYFVLSAYDGDGLESNASNEVVKEVP
jgi:hypothetical protein